MLMNFVKSFGENANYELHLLGSHQVCTQNKSTSASRPQIRVCWEQQLYFKPACIVKCSCHQPNAGTGNSKANRVGVCVKLLGLNGVKQQTILHHQ